MTTIPNDAAVSAENAAKHTDAGLIEQLRITLNQWDRNPLQPLRVLDIALVAEATEWIKRHATPQTQATQADARKRDCLRCQGSGEAQIYVEDGGGSFTDGPDGHTETGTCPDCEGEGWDKTAWRAEIARFCDDAAAGKHTQATHGGGIYGGPPPGLLKRNAEFSRLMAELVAKENAATHGEGEAKYNYCAKHHRWPCAECGTSHYDGCDCPICVPSPTADLDRE